MKSQVSEPRIRATTRSPASPLLTPGRPAHPGRRAIALSIFALVVMMSAGFVVLISKAPTPTPPAAGSLAPGSAPAPRVTLAILGVRDPAGRPETSRLAAALAERLSVELARGGELRLISKEAVARTLAGVRIDELGSLDPVALAEVRDRLAVEYVIAGTLLVSGAESGDLRLVLHLQDAANGGAQTFEHTGSADRLAELVDRSGAELRARLGVTER